MEHGVKQEVFMLYRVENRYCGHYFWHNYVTRNNSNKLKLTKIMGLFVKNLFGWLLVRLTVSFISQHYFGFLSNTVRRIISERLVFVINLFFQFSFYLWYGHRINTQILLCVLIYGVANGLSAVSLFDTDEKLNVKLKPQNWKG